MFWWNFIINTAVFLLVFNISRLASWYQTRRWIGGNLVFTVFLPIYLALLLTVVDSFRLFFAYQLAFFLVGAVGIYWLVSYLNRFFSK